MTPARLQALAGLLLSALVSLYAAARSRRLPSLRPAAAACLAFVALDAARWLWGPAVAAGVWPASWADVVVMGVMPGVWGALLLQPKEVAKEIGAAALPSPSGVVGHRHVLGHGSAAPEESHDVASGGTLRRAVAHGARGVAWWIVGAVEETGLWARANHARILPRLAPPAACLLYASLLLALRHEPAVRERWTAALQVPRIVVFAGALWVGLRGRARKDGGPDREAEPSAPLGGEPQRCRASNPGPRLERGRHPGQRGEHLASPPLSAQPSLLIGLSMALASGLLVVWGAWGAGWHQVQVGAAGAWIVAAVVVWRAR